MRVWMNTWHYRGIWIVFLSGLAAISLYSLVTFFYQKHHALAEIDQRLHQAALGALEIVKSQSAIVGEQKSFADSDYQKLIMQMSEFARRSDVEYVYTLEKIADSIFFTSSSYTAEDAESGLVTRYFDVYESTTPTQHQAFLSQTIQYENTVDKWGEFRSILLPYTTESGRTILICADINLAEVKNATLNSLYFALISGVYFLGLSFLYGLAYVYKMRSALTLDPASGFANHAALSELLKKARGQMSLAVIGCKDLADIGSFYGQDVLDACVSNLLQQLSDSLGKEYKYFRFSPTKVVVVANKEIAYEDVLACLTELNVGSPILDSPLIYTKIHIGCDNGLSSQVLENALLAETIARSEDLMLQCYSSAFNELKSKYQYNIVMSAEISQAFTENRFVPFFQPIISVESGAIVKYEALARLKDKQGNFVPPFKFLPVIYRSRLDRELVKTMFLQCAQRFNQTNVCWSINMSAADMMDPALCHWLLEQLELYSNPKNITFELLETEGVDDYASIKVYINKYQAAGVKIFIDDFGVGYSNISHFLKLNVDGLKIDGSLIERICEDKDIRLFIEHIVQFANSVGFEVVAEYIENEQILAEVAGLGVHMAQGYHFSAPVEHIELDVAAA